LQRGAGIVVGESIGSFKVVAKLGEGGMGAVYLGEHKRIARKVAIKVLLPELSVNHEIVERFFNEARATSLIRHPGIVDVTDCDLLPNGSAYIVMEYLEGETLGASLRRGERLSVAHAAFLTRHVAHALAAAHEKRIVHRDLKPDNIFLPSGAASGDSPTKILDFGIAKLLKTEVGENKLKTRTGSIIGTPAYMSPEQCRGIGDIDHRTDIYSLGCMLFEMLCGRPPFVSEGFGELIQAHLSVAPPSIRALDLTLPSVVDGLVARMLAKSPGERPQTMRELVALLDAVIAAAPATSDPVVLKRAPGAQFPVPTTLRSASAEKMSVTDEGEPIVAPRAHRSAVLIGGVVVAALALGLGALRGRSKPAAPAPIAALPAPVVPAPPPSSPAPAVEEAPPAPPPAVAVEEPPPAVVSKKAASSAAARKVKVFISSDPPGADVCLAGNRVLLGKTKLEWTIDKGTKDLKLMVRKVGYRGQDITFVPDGDFAKRVELDRLGPDDIDDAGCQPR
jgi:serine/threonine-protein kinase